MTSVRINDGESFDTALKRFKKLCEKAGILTEIKKREAYESPNVRKKKKKAIAKRRALKKLMQKQN